MSQTSGTNRSALDLVGLSAIMRRTHGHPDVVVGLIDGPVATQHPDLASERIRFVNGNAAGTCTRASSLACLHGTFLAGILSARRESAAPAIAPECTLLVRPIFGEAPGGRGNGGMRESSADAMLPSTSPSELATAILECVAAGARVLNLSVALVQATASGEREIRGALDEAARRGTLVAVAAGNQGVVGSSALTRHPWVLPVVALGRGGTPISQSNLAASFGKQGLGASGDEITSLSPAGKAVTLGGTSVAAPFVSGAIALLWSLVPRASAPAVRWALTRAVGGPRNSIVPPVMDAGAAYQILASTLTE
jgi:subtilisin family serine protease